MSTTEQPETQMTRGEIVTELIELESMRRNATKMQTRIVNNVLALIRRSKGWQWYEDEQTRARINAEADRTRKAIEKGHRSHDAQREVADPIVPYVVASAAARDPYDKLRDNCEKRMAKIASQLPAWPLLKDINGFSAKGLAAIVGEAGDLSSYPNPSKLWKRLGLAPMKGHACSTWRSSGLRQKAGEERGLEAEEWAEAGYNPSRRAILYAYIEDPLIRARGHYKAIYDARREHTAVTHPDWTKMHSANDARRYMAKRLVRDVWRAWRDAGPPES